VNRFRPPRVAQLRELVAGGAPVGLCDGVTVTRQEARIMLACYEALRVENDLCTSVELVLDVIQEGGEDDAA
jgi:hypothetical protein